MKLPEIMARLAERRSIAYARWKAGETFKAIAAEMGVHPATVSWWCHREAWRLEDEAKEQRR